MKYNPLVYALLFLCFLSCAQQPQKGREAVVVEIPEWFDNDSLRVAYLYSEGVKVAALAEDRTEALPYFERVFEIDSLHAPSHYQVGDMVVNDDSERGLRHGKVAYAADSTNVDYLGLYGYALLNQREVQRARGVYERLVKLEPHNTYNYRVLATLYKASNMPYMALSILDSAEYKLGRTPDISRQKLSLLVALSLYDRAIGEIKSDIANNPRDVENYLILGSLYSDSKQDSLAESCFKTVVEIDPQREEAYLGLATLFQQQGREEEFLQTLKTLFLLDHISPYTSIPIFNNDIVGDEEFYRRHFFTINSIISALYLKYPDYRLVQKAYATHLIKAGSTEKGLEIFKQIVREDNYLPNESLWTVVGGEDYLGPRDSAMLYLDLAIAHNPSFAEPYIQKAYKLLREDSDNSLVEAKKLFKRALRVTDDSEEQSDIYCALASLENTTKKISKLFCKALEVNPNNAMALNNWAYSLIDSPQDLPFALEMSNRACELEPSMPTYLDTKAWILFLMGNTQEAKKVMRQAISLDDSGDSTFLLHYGDILAAEGDVFMAEIYYKRALDAGEEAEVIEKRIEALKR